MKHYGVNWLAVLVAAAAIFATGYLVYDVLFAAYYVDVSGATAESTKHMRWRYGLSPLMPLLIAYGVARAAAWRGAAGLPAGLTTGLLIWTCFLLPARLYNYAYTAQSDGWLALDAAHLLLDALAAGAVIGLWPNKADAKVAP